jgi:hypothetical protein
MGKGAIEYIYDYSSYDLGRGNRIIEKAVNTIPEERGSMGRSHNFKGTGNN